MINNINANTERGRSRSPRYDPNRPHDEVGWKTEVIWQSEPGDDFHLEYGSSNLIIPIRAVSIGRFTEDLQLAHVGWTHHDAMIYSRTPTHDGTNRRRNDHLFIVQIPRSVHDARRVPLQQAWVIHMDNTGPSLRLFTFLATRVYFPPNTYETHMAPDAFRSVFTKEHKPFHEHYHAVIWI